MGLLDRLSDDVADAAPGLDRTVLAEWDATSHSNHGDGPPPDPAAMAERLHQMIVTRPPRPRRSRFRQNRTRRPQRGHPGAIGPTRQTGPISLIKAEARSLAQSIDLSFTYPSSKINARTTLIDEPVHIPQLPG